LQYLTALCYQLPRAGSSVERTDPPFRGWMTSKATTPGSVYHLS